MKKKQGKQFLTNVLLFVMAILFTACGKDATETSKTNTRSEYLYQPTYQSIEIKMDYIQSACKKEDRIYMYGSTWEEAKEKNGEGRSIYYIASCNIDGSDLQEKEIKGLKDNEYVMSLAVDDKDQLLFMTQEYEYNEETGEDKQYYRIHRLNQKGKIEDTVELKKDKKDSDEYFYLDSNCVVFLDGMIYIGMDKKIYSFDEKGKAGKSYEIEEDMYIQKLILSAEGKLYTYGWLNEGDSGKQVFIEFKPKEGKFGDPIDLGEYNIYGQSMHLSESSKVLVNDGNNIYSVDLSNGKLTTELNWINSDVDGDSVRECFPLEDGKILAISTNYQQSTQKNITEIVTLNKIKASEVKEKKVLIYAGATMDYSVKEKILSFNKTNENYRIEVRDYSGYDDSARKLNLDITSGKVPDILDVSYGISKDALIKKGLFLDIYPFMEQDKEIKKEDFIPSVLSTMEVEEKLYFLPYSFNIQGLISGKKMIGDREGWTVKEMMEMYKAMPKGSVFMTDMSRQGFCYNMITRQLNEYIDWNTGKVDFNNDDFIELVEFSKSLPKEEELQCDDDMVVLRNEGKLFLESFYLQDPVDIIGYEKTYKKQKGYQILSYPSSDKSNQLSMGGLGSMLAITKQCKEAEGAWEFIRQFLTYDFQKTEVNYCFPVRKDMLERRLEQVQATKSYKEEDGTKVNTIMEEYGYDRALTKEEAEMIRSIVERIGTCSSYDTATDEIGEIINEELQAFYTGDKTAKEAAEIIQSRAKIYVSENS